LDEEAIEASSCWFRFGALEARLADMHQIDSRQRTKFQARLKNLHRLGFPPGMQASPGKATVYEEPQIVQMALAVELTQAGLLPERLIDVYRRNEYPILMAVSMGARALLRKPRGFDPEEVAPGNDPLSMFIFFDPSALGPLMVKPDDEDQASATFFYGGSGAVAENIVRWTTGPIPRLCLINVTTMLWRLVRELGGTTQRIFFNAVAEWADELVTRDDYDLEAWIHDTLLAKTLPAPPSAVKRHKGPITLADLIEKSKFAGLRGHLFDVPRDSGFGVLPDLELHLPGQRSILVDAGAYQTTLRGREPMTVPQRVDFLAGMPFRTPFVDAANYTILYVPEQRQLTEALEEYPDLASEALSARVILAGPADFLCILHAAQVQWDIQQVVDDARGTDDDWAGLSKADFEGRLVESGAAAGVPRVVTRRSIEAMGAEYARRKASAMAAAGDTPLLKDEPNGGENGDRN
jgi:hypothetical protein